MRIPVWAPEADEVTLLIGPRRLAMDRDGDREGWWVSPHVAHGSDYLVEIDGTAIPDPLARWLPAGVHRPSRAFDAATVDWTDSGWSGRALDHGSVIYELHVGTFTQAGTLDSAIERLDHLADLGITHVELMPIAAFDGAHGWGYDGVALNAVHEAYGGPFALARFVDAAHGHGIAVILDVVHNHLGPSGNYWDTCGPFFTDAHSTPWGRAVNLDGPGSDDVRAIIVSSATGWLRDFHMDGLRLDAVHELRDSRAHTLLEELADTVSALSAESHRPLSLIAESDRNDPRTVMRSAEGGLGMTAQWDDDVHHALHWILTGESGGYYADFASCSAAAHALERAFLHDGRWSSFRQRTHGRPVDFERTPPARFVVSLQTHDQVGNRARGERLSHLVDRDRLAAGALLLMALPYTPMLFMGEEWGAATPWQYFTSFDEELGRAVTGGRRAEFAAHDWDAAPVPDPQDPATRAASVLAWSELAEADARRLRDWYRSLLAWRRSDLRDLPAAQCAWSVATEGRPAWWSIARGPNLCAVNLSADDATLTLDSPARDVSVRRTWSGRYSLVDAGRSASALTIGPGESLALRLDGRH